MVSEGIKTLITGGTRWIFLMPLILVLYEYSIGAISQSKYYFVSIAIIAFHQAAVSYYYYSQSNSQQFLDQTVRELRAVLKHPFLTSSYLLSMVIYIGSIVFLWNKVDLDQYERVLFTILIFGVFSIGFKLLVSWRGVLKVLKEKSNFG